jgi:membrane fusion protein (multidrug efflux system)
MLLRALAALILACLLPLPAAAQFGPQGPPAVGFIVAERRPVTELTEFVGRIEAINRVDIRARVTGFLEARLFQEGTEVPEGAALFRLEKAPFEAALDQARAARASAEASLANARVALVRARDLRQTGAGTQVALDNANAAERTSTAQLLGAEAAVRVAEINLAYTDVTAPVAGAIGRANYTPGNTVGPQSPEPLATIVSQDPMRVAFTVAQRQALELRVRFEGRGGVDAAQVRVRSVDGRIYPHVGRIDFVDTALDRTTDTLLVRASIPNPVRENATPGAAGSRGLIDGQFVTVLLEGAEPITAIVIPRVAVAQDQQGFHVFVVDEQNRAQRRNVTLGRGTPETAVIEAGLEPGDRVITEGVQRARAGAPVNAMPAGARPPGPAGGPPGAARG